MGLDFELWAEIRRKSDGKPVTRTKGVIPECSRFSVFWSGDYDIMHGVIDTLNQCCGTSYDENTGSMDVPAEALVPIYRYLLSRCWLAPDDPQTKNLLEYPDIHEHPLFTEHQNLFLAKAVHDVIVDVMNPTPWGVHSKAHEAFLSEEIADHYEAHPDEYEWHFVITNWW